MSPCPPSQFMCQARGGACLGGEPRPPTPLAPPLHPALYHLPSDQITESDNLLFCFILGVGEVRGWESGGSPPRGREQWSGRDWLSTVRWVSGAFLSLSWSPLPCRGPPGPCAVSVGRGEGALPREVTPSVSWESWGLLRMQIR